MGEEKNEVDLVVINNRLSVIIKKLEIFENRLNGFESKFDRMNNMVRPLVEKMMGDD